jgi:hypothetical protein
LSALVLLDEVLHVDALLEPQCARRSIQVVPDRVSDYDVLELFRDGRIGLQAVDDTAGKLERPSLGLLGWS